MQFWLSPGLQQFPSISKTTHAYFLLCQYNSSKRIPLLNSTLSKNKWKCQTSNDSKNNNVHCSRILSFLLSCSQGISATSFKWMQPFKVFAYLNRFCDILIFFVFALIPLRVQRRIQNPVKNLRWNLLHVWLVSKYASECLDQNDCRYLSHGPTTAMIQQLGSCH